jgi:hypothetical protein
MKVRKRVLCVVVLALTAAPISGGFAAEPVRDLKVGLVSDMIRDPHRNLLYAAYGTVYPYDLATGELLLSQTVLEIGRRIDLSPDGSRLVGIADAISNTAPFSNWLTVKDLNLGTSTIIEFPPLISGEGGGFDVAFIDNETLLVTTTYRGSGSVPLRQIDITTGQVTFIGEVYENTLLEPSGDRSVIAISDGNGFWGPFSFFDVPTRSLHSGEGAQPDVRAIAPNRNGEHFAVATLDGVEIFDRAFKSVGKLKGNYPYYFPADVLFSPVSDVLYVSWTGSISFNPYPESVVAYDANTLQILETIDDSTSGLAKYFGELAISRDGRELFVSSENYDRQYWVALYDVAKYGVPEPSGATLMCTTAFALLAILRRDASQVRRTSQQ